jgi:hypothetical protein
VGAAGETLIPVSLPVMDPVVVSVAVRDCAPAVLSVALKVPVPLLSVASAGRVACGSELVKWTVPK